MATVFVLLATFITAQADRMNDNDYFTSSNKDDHIHFSLQAADLDGINTWSREQTTYADRTMNCYEDGLQILMDGVSINGRSIMLNQSETSLKRITIRQTDQTLLTYEGIKLQFCSQYQPKTVNPVFLKGDFPMDFWLNWHEPGTLVHLGKSINAGVAIYGDYG